MADACMVYDEHGNAFHYFEYTPEALEAEALKLRRERGEVSTRATMNAETLAATHDWVREFVGDHAYAHGLADDVFDLLAERDRLQQLSLLA